MKIAALPLALALAAGLVAAGGGFALTQTSPDPVLARVDGKEIHESDLALAEADIGSGLPAGAPQARREALLTYLIDVTILANAAEQQKIAQEPNFERRVAYARQKVLMETLLDRESQSAASEPEMKKIYDDSVAQNKPVEEVRARHILVETEEKAKEVLAKLNGGADFAELAKAESKDPGASDGGDLGYFVPEQMVKEFADAAFALEKGAISRPVKTQFGWHIIKLEDRRNKPVPSFEQVKDQIETYLVRRAQTELVGKLRQAAKVERVEQKPGAGAVPQGGEQKK
jgi:peptidyl-prolyl cis-trans isomerase C